MVALPPVILLQRSLLHSQLKAQARTDPKTGVLNAGAWQGEAALAIARAQRHREPLALLLADVDHFKMVNDTHGHLTGDAVLRTLATEMRQQVRESDLVGRFGGEEFVILLTATGAAEACQVAERIRRGACVVKVLTPDTIVGVTVSIGVAALGSHGADLFELLAAADIALYRAKNTGRDRVCALRPGRRRQRRDRRHRHDRRPRHHGRPRHDRPAARHDRRLRRTPAKLTRRATLRQHAVNCHRAAEGSAVQTLLYGVGRARRLVGGSGAPSD